MLPLIPTSDSIGVNIVRDHYRAEKVLSFLAKKGSKAVKGLYPHLTVKPPVTNPTEILMKRGAGANAAYSIDMRPGKQSLQERARAIDNILRRDEDWNKRHASAEPVKLGSFPSYSSSATKSFTVAGSLPIAQEARELQVVFEFTLAANSGTSTLVNGDFNTIASALFNKFRTTLYGIGDCYNLFPAEVRSIAYVANSRDLYTQFFRSGFVTTTTPQAVKLKLVIPFCNRNLEVPEIFSPTSDQLNLPGAQMNVDTNGAGLTAVSIGATPAAHTVVVTDVKAYAILNQIPVLHAGPPHVWKNRQVPQSTDTESGQGCDMFVASEELPATGAARVNDWSVARDGRQQPLNVDPITLAQAYGESSFTADGNLPLDFTVALTGAGGTLQGAALTPLEWIDGRIRGGAWQWPFWLASRQIRQNLISGQSATFNLLYWQIRPVYETAGQILSLAAANQLAVSSVDQLQIRGGNDGDVNAVFKGRFMALRK